MLKTVFLFAALIVLLTSCGGGGGAGDVGGAPAATTPPILAPLQVGIDAGTATAMSIMLGEQLDDFAAFDSLIGSQARLTALALPYFRIHAGADAAILPEPFRLDGRAVWDFTALNRLVEIAYTAQAQPIMNVRTSPVSLSTCRSFHSGSGGMKDATFEQFASYMANLVAYYNLGRFTDSAGVVRVNPLATSRRITYWELWNEPDLFYEFPCLKPEGTPSLTQAEFITMWTAAARKMKAVDPTIKLVGPAVSDPRNLSYLNALVAAGHKPDVVSAHAYAGPITSSDADLIHGGGNAFGIRSIAPAVANIMTALDAAGMGTTPIFVDEFNISPDGIDDPLARGWNNFSVAAGGAAFITLARQTAVHAVTLIPFQFVEAGGVRLSALHATTGQPLLPYWRDALLRQAIKAGDFSLAVSSSPATVEVLASRAADESSIRVLVANLSSQVAGAGTQANNPPLNLNIIGQGGRTPKSVTLKILDSSTDLQVGPAAVNLDPMQAPRIQFNGYGLALVELSY